MFRRVPVGDKFAMVDKEMYEELSQYKWHLSNGYAVSSKAGSMHRYIMKPSKEMEVDHINGNRLNNMKSNLRICTRAQNAKNVAPAKDRPLKGVSVRKNGMYKAVITVDGEQIYLGDFKTLKAAIHEYNAAAVEYHGEFARLNSTDPRDYK